MVEQALNYHVSLGISGFRDKYDISCEPFGNMVQVYKIQDLIEET